MRMRLAVPALLSAVIVLAACTSPSVRSAGVTPRMQRNPVVLKGEPSCTFRVVSRISGGPRDTGRNTVVEQARAVGADAVMGLHYTPQFDSSRRPVGSTWEAIAIDFSDPSDPSCYR
jgi:hypothetical protein